MLAAYGSGAARRSFDDQTRLLNVDIGGGTAKLALIEHGKVVGHRRLSCRRTSAGDGRRTVSIVRLDPAGRHHAGRAGFDWREGDHVSSADLDRVASIMADTLLSAITEPQAGRGCRPSLFDRARCRRSARSTVSFFPAASANISTGAKQRDFGDLGRRLGSALRSKGSIRAPCPGRFSTAGECIRATALGASEYSIQLSGSTSFISNPGRLLPRRNLQVLQPAGRSVRARSTHRQ